MQSSIHAELKWITALAGLILSTGCSDRSPGRVSDPSSPVADGTRVTGQLEQLVEIVEPAGTTLIRSMPTRSFNAIVRNGSALIPWNDGQPSTPVALGTGKGVVTDGRPITFIDVTGHRHELLLSGTPGRGPVTRIRYLIDRQLIADASYEWNTVDGGWLLNNRVLSVLPGGRLALRYRQTMRSASLATAGIVPEPLRRVGRALARPLSLSELQAATPEGCWSEWLGYSSAAAGVVAATEAFTIQPYNPVTWSLLLAAIGLWEVKLDALISCQYSD